MRRVQDNESIPPNNRVKHKKKADVTNANFSMEHSFKLIISNESRLTDKNQRTKLE